MKTSRIMLAAFRVLVVVGCLSVAGCGHGSAGDASSPAADPTTSPIATHARSSASADAVPGSPPPFDVAPAADSAALRHFAAATVISALRVSNTVAYYSVADPALLARPASHGIDDYEKVTRFLAADGLAALRAALSKPNDQSARTTAAALALSLRNDHERGSTGRAAKTSGTRFDTPFAPRNYRVTIDPKVGLSPDGKLIVVAGTCSVEIPGTRSGTHYLVTIQRTLFKYYFSATPSRAAPVAISGWYSDSDATYRRI